MGLPLGIFQRKKLDDWGIRPDEEADLIFRQSDQLGWQETEERLYEDLEMKDQTQKITVTDTAGYQAVAGITGGYGMAALGAVIVLCGVYFLCHNVLQISMAGDIRKLGLLKHDRRHTETAFQNLLQPDPAAPRSRNGSRCGSVCHSAGGSYPGDPWQPVSPKNRRR